MIPAPADFDPKLLQQERTIAFVPYCCKPFDCPLNEQHGRKSNTCQAIADKCEHTSCSIGAFIKIARKIGVKDFFVIDTDSELIKWLSDKRSEGYTHVIGVACEFAVSYALEVIHGQLGYDGLIVIINGDKCRTKVDYAESDASWLRRGEHRLWQAGNQVLGLQGRDETGERAGPAAVQSAAATGSRGGSRSLII